MKRVIYLVLIMVVSFSLTGERNNHAVIITGSTPELAKGSGNFPMLFDGQFMKYECEEGRYTNDPYNAFWNDTYLTWELLWYYQKFSLFEYSSVKYYDHIFVLYGEGEDDHPENPRYTGEWHDEHGWAWPYDITDYLADHEYLDTVIHNLSEGYWGAAGYIDPMGKDDHLFCWTFDHGTSAWITHSVDISDINNPQPLDYSFLAELGDGIDVEGNYAYTVGYREKEGIWKGLVMVTDISDPSNLQERGVLELEDRPRAIDVVGDYAYVVTYQYNDYAFLVVDVSDPDKLEIVGRAIYWGYMEDVEVKDTLAFVIDRTPNKKLYMINIKDPSDPQVINSIFMTNPWDLSVEGNFVYVVYRYMSGAYLTYLDINSWQRETRSIDFLPSAVVTDENYIYVIGVRDLYRQHILKIYARFSLQEISSLILPSYGSIYAPLNISRKDTLLYTAVCESGVHIVNVSDPENPELVSSYHPDGSYITEAVRKDDCLYLSGLGSEGSKSYLCLMDYPIRDSVFAEKFKSVQAGEKVYWMQQCYSGGFIDDLEDTNTVVTTACEASEFAWSADDIPWYNIDDWQLDPNPPLNWENYVVEGSENEIVNDVTYYHGEFNFHIMNMVRRVTPTGSGNIGSSAGYDDYLISMSEAYNHVNSWDSREYPVIDSLGNTLPPEHPQYSDIGNIGDEIFLGWDDGFAPLPPTGLDYSISAYPPDPNYVIVNLTWDENTEEDLAAYNIYHKVPGGQWGLPVHRQNTSYSHKVRAGSIHYYYLRAYDMMKQKSEPSSIITVFALLGGMEGLSFGGDEEPSGNTIYREGYTDLTSFEFPEKKADYGDSLVYEMNINGPSYLLHVYYSPEDISQNMYVNGTEISSISHKRGLLKFSIYRLTGVSGDAIIKIKGIDGDAYMSFLVITDNIINRKVEDEKLPLNVEDHDMRLLNSMVRSELYIAGLEGRTGKVKLGIYDVQGRKIVDRDLEVPTNGVLRLSYELPNGIYILRLRNNKEEYTEKFTVIR